MRRSAQEKRTIKVYGADRYGDTRCTLWFSDDLGGDYKFIDLERRSGFSLQQSGKTTAIGVNRRIRSASAVFRSDRGRIYCGA